MKTAEAMLVDEVAAFVRVRLPRYDIYALDPVEALKTGEASCGVRAYVGAAAFALEGLQPWFLFHSSQRATQIPKHSVVAIEDRDHPECARVINTDNLAMAESRIWTPSQIRQYEAEQPEAGFHKYRRLIGLDGWFGFEALKEQVQEHWLSR